MNLSIVIPCLNEKRTIVRAVTQALTAARRSGLTKYEVIVADNGSTDGTREKVTKLMAQHSQLRLLTVKEKGYGAALHTGILAAKYKYALFADADLSYPFRQLPIFINELQRDADLVLGSRFAGKIEEGAMPWLHRYVGTPILSFLINVVYGIHTTDCNSGMRVIRTAFYKQLMMKNSGMEWASELLIKTSLHEGRFAEVPITFKKDQRGRKPHLDSWHDGWRHLKVIILLKPKLFVVGMLIFLSIAGVYWRIDNHILAVASLLIAEFLAFSYMALKKLEEAIEGTSNSVTRVLNRLPLVLTGAVLTLIGMAQLFIVPNSYGTVKYMILFQVLFFDIWLFFIETINTHLIRPLVYPTK